MAVISGSVKVDDAGLVAKLHSCFGGTGKSGDFDGRACRGGVVHHICLFAVDFGFGNLVAEIAEFIASFGRHAGVGTCAWFDGDSGFAAFH